MADKVSLILGAKEPPDSPILTSATELIESESLLSIVRSRIERFDIIVTSAGNRRRSSCFTSPSPGEGRP
jgi:hypothetical protein